MFCQQREDIMAQGFVLKISNVTAFLPLPKVVLSGTQSTF